MDIKEHFRGSLEYLMHGGYEVTEETDEQITLKKEDDDEDIIMISFDKEAEKYMSSINKISIIHCDKTQYLLDKSAQNYLEFQYKEKLFRFICNLDFSIEDLHLSEYVSIGMEKGYKEIDKNMEGKLEKEEISILKEFILLFRKYIISKKEYRLRLLFKPLEIYNDINWLINA